MAMVSDVPRNVRSRTPGAFGVAVDLFFREGELFRRYRDAPALGPELFERLCGTDPGVVKRLPVDTVRVIKISFPRAKPQGWMGERDMHAGQYYARLLDVDIG